jgi:hypothetical protein
MPHWDRTGWEEKMELLGCAGVRLLDAITDLDAGSRLSAEAAVRHEYFQKPAPGPGDAEVFLKGETFIQACCPAGCQDWCPETDESGVCEDVDMELACLQADKAASVAGDCVADLENQVEDVPQYISKPRDFGYAWNSLCHRSFEYYLDRDFAKERSRQMHILTCIKATSNGNLSKDLPPPVVHIICSFVFNIYSPKVIKITNHPLGCDITTNMRAILNDWLAEVAWKYRLHNHVVFFAVEIVDAYLLADKSLLRKHFQLLGVVALSMACKIFEEYAPQLTDFVYICDHAYTMQQVIDFELKVVNTLRNVESKWGCVHFFAYYTKELRIPSLNADAYAKAHFYAGLMCLERSLLRYHLSRHVPSLLAAAACLLAANMLTESAGWEAWEEHGGPGRHLCELSGRSFEKLTEVAMEMATSFDPCVNNGGKMIELIGYTHKYKRMEFCRVADLLPFRSHGARLHKDAS